MATVVRQIRLATPARALIESNAGDVALGQAGALELVELQRAPELVEGEPRGPGARA